MSNSTGFKKGDGRWRWLLAGNSSLGKSYSKDLSGQKLGHRDSAGASSASLFQSLVKWGAPFDAAPGETVSVNSSRTNWGASDDSVSPLFQTFSHWSASPVTNAVEAVPTRYRQVIFEISKKLAKLESSELELGARMEAMEDIFVPAINDYGDEVTDALSSVVLTDENYFSDEAKVAAIRYLGIYDNDRLQQSRLSALFFGTLEAGSDAVATAAAHSLTDLGGAGSLPALKAARKRVKSPRAKKAMEKAIRLIEDSNGILPTA